MITAYVEVSSDYHVALALSQNGALDKLIATSSDQDIFHTNMLKQEGFMSMHVVQIRGFVKPGHYFL